jgi:antitoxin VapB
MTTAKLFQNGQSQAVRLPKEFRFDNLKEVFIKKINGMVVLMTKESTKTWDDFFDNLDNFSEDFMLDRVQPEQQREELF